MAERQIGRRKSSLVLSARFPVVKWRSRSVGKSAYYRLKNEIYYIHSLLKFRAAWLKISYDMTLISGEMTIGRLDRLPTKAELFKAGLR